MSEFTLKNLLFSDLVHCDVDQEEKLNFLLTFGDIGRVDIKNLDEALICYCHKHELME